MNRARDDTTSGNVEENSSPKRRKVIGFPGRHQNGAANVYRRELRYRDNSSYLELLFNHESNAICFTRPMQLGKTILFSLANELFSVNEESNVDKDLSYSPGEGDRNNWYVLRINFGTVRHGYSQDDEEAHEKWINHSRALDKAAEMEIKQSVVHLLSKKGSEQLKESFFEMSEGTKVRDLPIGQVMSALFRAVDRVSGRLLILVDEYDKPIRDGLLQLILIRKQELYSTVKAAMTEYYSCFFGFFSAVKVALDTMPRAKVWLTGIAPIGIREMSGLNVVQLTFSEEMADAVGLTETDVQRMLDDVHTTAPFQDGDRDRAMEWLRRYYNNLRFPYGQPLYHTALINAIMNTLLKADSQSRQIFLQTGQLPRGVSREPVSSSIFNILSHARNLRHVVNKIAYGGKVNGYKLNDELSLEDLLREPVDVGDYLTLLVHVGVVSVEEERRGRATFFGSSQYYSENLLEPLFKALRVSLETLVSFTSKNDLYNKGEDILVDFVTSISKTNMSRLMAWASADPDNHNLELQLQAHVVTEAHSILEGIAQTTQEDRLPSTNKRTDVTFSSTACVVVLELKQVAGTPAAAFITKAHEQLAGYVETRRQMENVGQRRPVAGFVVIMCNDGAGYVVEKLRGDNSKE